MKRYKNSIILFSSIMVMIMAIFYFYKQFKNAASESKYNNDISSFSSKRNLNSDMVSGANLFLKKVQVTKAFLTPIAFYGQVVDQYGSPVPEADVIIWALDSAVNPSSKYTRKTDLDGLFSIGGIFGSRIDVAVSKLGYLMRPRDDKKVTSTGQFEYSDLGSGVHRPDKNTPVIFTLYKVGTLEPLIRIERRTFSVARDGTPLEISLDQKGGHKIILRCWNSDLQRLSNQRQYDWRLETSVLGGGLLVRNDGYLFQAPIGGYTQIDTVNMPAVLSSDQWRSFSEKSYFLQFEDKTFARVNLEMRAGGDHFVVCESFYNPKVGSTNLEFDSGK